MPGQRGDDAKTDRVDTRSARFHGHALVVARTADKYTLPAALLT